MLLQIHETVSCATGGVVQNDMIPKRGSHGVRKSPAKWWKPSWIWTGTRPSKLSWLWIICICVSLLVQMIKFEKMYFSICMGWNQQQIFQTLQWEEFRLQFWRFQMGNSSYQIRLHDFMGVNNFSKEFLCLCLWCKKRRWNCHFEVKQWKGVSKIVGQGPLGWIFLHQMINCTFRLGFTQGDPLGYHYWMCQFNTNTFSCSITFGRFLHHFK